MEKKLVCILVVSLMMSAAVPVVGISNFVKPEIEENSTLIETPGEPADVGLLKLNYISISSGNIPYVRTLNEDVNVTWPDGTGKIKVEWKVMKTGELIFDRFLKWVVTFELIIYEKNGDVFDQNSKQIVLKSYQDGATGELSIPVDTNQGNFEEINGQYKIECEIKATLRYGILGLFWSVFDMDKGFPVIWVNKNIEKYEPQSFESNFNDTITVGESYIKNYYPPSRRFIKLPYAIIRGLSSEVNWTTSKGTLQFNCHINVEPHLLPTVGEFFFVILDENGCIYDYNYFISSIPPGNRTIILNHSINMEIDIDKGRFETIKNKTTIYFNLIARVGVGFGEKSLRYYDMDKDKGTVVIKRT